MSGVNYFPALWLARKASGFCGIKGDFKSTLGYGPEPELATDMLSYRQLPSPSHRLAAYRPNSERLTDSDMVTKTYVKWPTSRAR